MSQPNATNPIIYALIDPRTNLVRYVGQSKYGVIRLKKHLLPTSLYDQSHRSHWIRQLLNAFLIPEIVILERCCPTILNEREIYWIAYYKRQVGDKLTNMTVGGDGGDTGTSYKRKKPVISLNLKTRQSRKYFGVHDTSKDGFSPTKVTAVCRGKRKSHKGHYFYYEGTVPIIQKSKCARQIKVTDLTNNAVQIYDKIKDFENTVGFTRHTILNAIYKNTPIKGRYQIQRI